MQQDKIKEFIEALFGKMKLDLQSVQPEQLTEHEWYFNIESGEESLLLAGHGDVLRSLQQLVKAIARSQGWILDGESFRLDAGKYRFNQEENGKKRVVKSADDVQSTGRVALMPPMSSFFRRLVHLEIAEKFPKLSSWSEGTGDYRAVRIAKKGSEQDRPTEVRSEEFSM